MNKEMIVPVFDNEHRYLLYEENININSLWIRI